MGRIKDLHGYDNGCMEYQKRSTSGKPAIVIWRDITQLEICVENKDITDGMLIRFETFGRAKYLKKQSLWVVTMEQPLGGIQVSRNPPVKKLIPDMLVDEVIWLQEKPIKRKRKRNV